MKAYGIGGYKVALASRKFKGFVVIDSAKRKREERILDGLFRSKRELESFNSTK